MICDETIQSTELAVLLSDVKGAAPVALVTETKPPCYKGSPVVVKRSEVSGFIHGEKADESLRGNEYERTVNRRLEAEGKEANFKPAAMPWGIRFGQTCLVVHVKDGVPRAYLRIDIRDTKEPKYFIDDKEVSKEEASKFMRPRKPSSRQGTESEVIIRQYQVTPGDCSVRAIAINGRKILVEDI